MSEQWIVDLKAQKVTHATQPFFVQFDGDPTSSHCDGKPSRFPDQLTALQKVRLVREAYDAYIEAWQEAHKKPANPTVASDTDASPAPARKSILHKSTLSIRRKD